MATNTSESDGRNSQAKSKLDTLSREDLIRFVKRQLEHVNLSKMEIKRLKQSLEEKDAAINDLLAENSQLKSSERENNEAQVTSPVENGSAVNADMEQLLELNAQLTNEIALLKKERTRHEDDLAAVLQTNNHLRSQLDDALQEAAALREQQTATDVFSLELKDYEKKMVQLNKSLKNAETALEAVKVEKEELIQQLSTQKGSSVRITTECSVLQRQLQEVKNELNEEKSRNRELSTAMDRLQDNFNVLVSAKNDERVTLEAKIAHNEELTNFLQRSNEQKSMEISDLLAENQVLKSRCDNLEADYQAYKSRARYVLEQQAKTVESDATNKQDNTEQVREGLACLKHELEELYAAHKIVLRDVGRYRDQCEKLESSNRSAKGQLAEAQRQNNKTNEELLNCQMMLKIRGTECYQLQVRTAELEKQLQEEVNANKKKIRALHEEIASKAVMEAELTSELERERSRCEDAIRRLTEIQKERSRVVIPPVFPQHSRERTTDSYPPAEITGRTSTMSSNTFKDEEEEVLQFTYVPTLLVSFDITF
nr:girdin isoform 1 [Haemonchus contortus]